MDTLNQKDIRTLINEGNFNEVVNKYKKIVEIEPNNYKAHNNLGNALKELGKFKEATTSYRQAIKIQPDYSKAHFNLAIAYDILKNSEAAISHARKAEVLYDQKRKHRQVRQVRRYLNVLNEKYRFLK